MWLYKNDVLELVLWSAAVVTNAIFKWRSAVTFMCWDFGFSTLSSWFQLDLTFLVNHSTVRCSVICLASLFTNIFMIFYSVGWSTYSFERSFKSPEFLSSTLYSLIFFFHFSDTSFSLKKCGCLLLYCCLTLITTFSEEKKGQKVPLILGLCEFHIVFVSEQQGSSPCL